MCFLTKRRKQESSSSLKLDLLDVQETTRSTDPYEETKNRKRLHNKPALPQK